MPLLRKFVWWLRRRRRDADLHEEIRFHLEEETDARLAQGASLEQARCAAVRDFGNTAVIVERAQEAWNWRWLDQVRQDVAAGQRTLRRTPGFTLTAVGVLTLGLGANLAFLHVLNAELFHRLSVRDAEAIVGLAPAMSYPAVQFYADRNNVFDYLIGEKTDGVFIEDDLQAETSTFVSRTYFRNLGIAPIAGRLLEDHDAEPGAPPVAVIAYRYWQHHYGGDRGIVGRVVRLNEKPVEIVGIAPSTFNGLSDNRPSLFIPLATHPYLFAGSQVLVDFTDRSTLMYAKRKFDVGVPIAEAELSALAVELQRQHPDQIKTTEPPMVLPLLPLEAASGLALVTLLVSLALIVACSNLGNLLLARGQVRDREVRIKTSLGATAGRIVRQLMVENVLLASLSVPAALALGYGLAKALLAVSDVPPDMHVVTDWWIVGAGVGLAVCSALVFGLAPAMQTVTKSKRTRTRRTFVGIQVAASGLLLIMTTVLVRAAEQTSTVDVRFDYRHMLVIAPHLYSHNTSGASARQILDDMAARVRAHPAVAGVSLSASPILGRQEVQVGRTDLPQLRYFQVPPSYFGFMNLPLVRGRLFSDTESNVVVVNESAARAMWPNADPLGKTIATTRFSAVRGEGKRKKMIDLIDRTVQQRTVVGVVKDSIASGRSAGEAYLAMSDADLPGAIIIVKTKDDPATFIRQVRSVAALPGLVPGAWLMRSDVEQGTGPPPGVLMSVASLGISATLLSAFGIFGLIAFSVALRTREIGVRMALGATHSRIVRTLAAQYTTAIGVGMVVGVGLAVILGFLIRNRFVGAGPQVHDPLSYGVALAVLLAVAATAILIPARRALRIDPATALRCE